MVYKREGRTQDHCIIVSPPKTQSKTNKKTWEESKRSGRIGIGKIAQRDEICSNAHECSELGTLGDTYRVSTVERVHLDLRSCGTVVSDGGLYSIEP